MADMIDVRDLLEEDIQLIERLVERLRARTKGISSTGKEAKREEREIEFAIWALGVKDELTREEIYDYL